MSATDVMAELDLDWANLVQTRSFADEIDGFIQRFPKLEALGSGAPNARLGAGDADEILHGLLAAYAAGSYPAGRTVLQCMLPAIKAIVRRSRRHYPDVQDLEQEAMAAMWGAINRYDLGHSEKVAMRLHGTTLTYVVGDRAPFAHGTRASRAPGLTEIATEDNILELLERPDAADPSSETCFSLMSASLGPTGEVLDVIAWGVDAGAITSEEANLLARLYAPDPDLPEYAELTSGRGNYQRRVAEELGLSHAALRQRASRAVRRLAEAVQAGL